MCKLIFLYYPVSEKKSDIFKYSKTVKPENTSKLSAYFDLVSDRTLIWFICYSEVTLTMLNA